MWQDLWIPPTFLPHLGLLCWPFFHLLTCGYPKNTCLLPWLVSFHYLFFHSENIIEPMHEARHSAKHRDNWSSPNTLILAGFLCYTPVSLHMKSFQIYALPAVTAHLGTHSVIAVANRQVLWIYSNAAFSKTNSFLHENQLHCFSVLASIYKVTISKSYRLKIGAWYVTLT